MALEEKKVVALFHDVPLVARLNWDGKGQDPGQLLPP